jgi:hypothetical protein
MLVIVRERIDRMVISTQLHLWLAPTGLRLDRGEGRETDAMPVAAASLFRTGRNLRFHPTILKNRDSRYYVPPGELWLHISNPRHRDQLEAST